MSQPPKKYNEFIGRFPELGNAWEAIGTAGQDGPLDDKICRLIKLGIAIGAQKEGPTHASVRKALKLGITKEEMEQIIPLAAGTIGLPSAVASWCWITETIEKNNS